MQTKARERNVKIYNHKIASFKKEYVVNKTYKMQKMNMFLYLLNFSKFISYHSLRSLEVTTNSLLGQEETTFHAMRRGEITPLQPMRGEWFIL